MASSQDWAEFNGTNASTKTDTVANMNWKMLDDNSTAYSASNAIITAGNNSFSKYQALRFTGTYNTLSVFSYKLSTTSPNDNAGSSANLTVFGSVLTGATTLTTPVSTAVGGDTSTLLNNVTAAGSFATSTGPLGAGTSTFAGGGGAAATVYACALRTQLRTGAGVAPGDIATVTLTAAWTES